MKKLIPFMLLVSMLCSCNSKDTYQQFQILIKNDSDTELTMILYPKDKYIVVRGCYDFSSFGGGCRETVFTVDPDQDASLYISDIIDNEPYSLAKQVFDSIHITFSGEPEPGIKFSPDRVTGYGQNLFSQNSTWTYEKKEYQYPSMFHITIAKSEDYTFLITRDN